MDGKTRREFDRYIRTPEGHAKAESIKAAAATAGLSLQEYVQETSAATQEVVAELLSGTLASSPDWLAFCEAHGVDPHLFDGD